MLDSSLGLWVQCLDLFHWIVEWRWKLSTLWCATFCYWKDSTYFSVQKILSRLCQSCNEIQRLQSAWFQSHTPLLLKVKRRRFVWSVYCFNYRSSIHTPARVIPCINSQGLGWCLKIRCTVDLCTKIKYRFKNRHTFWFAPMLNVVELVLFLRSIKLWEPTSLNRRAPKKLI